MIQRAFVSRNIDLLVRAYLVYVRPLVEYNLVVWLPYTIQERNVCQLVTRVGYLLTSMLSIVYLLHN